MSLLKRNGNSYQAVPDLFDDFLNRNLFDWRSTNFSDSGTTLPAVNIKETNENFEVEMAAPGMEKKDFNILLEGNTLTISAESNHERENKEGETYSRKEFSYFSFQRKFTLPKDVVDEEQINARYENGILQLIIPKKEEAKKKGPKMISIA
ncbi:MAG TPA: Hsp20/alpha crystallin family protein [Flavitalea sp.]|nr:Hsp20/alpha crystallin family protein [Flavitalea sp.]